MLLPCWRNSGHLEKWSDLPKVTYLISKIFRTSDLSLQAEQTEEVYVFNILNSSMKAWQGPHVGNCNGKQSELVYTKSDCFLVNQDFEEMMGLLWGTAMNTRF